jgi:heptosyltransferase-3
MTSALVALATALFGFGLPLSTAMVAIGAGLLALAFVLRIGDAIAMKPWRIPVMAIGLALLALIVVRTLVADTGADAWHRINQYHELLLAPILLVVWRKPEHRRIFLTAFIAGCVVLAVRVWLSHGSEQAYALMQRHRIGSGFALALASFLLLLRAAPGRRGWMALVTSAFLAVTVIFGMDGRTGLVVLLILAACAAWVRSPRRWRAAAAGGTLVVLAAGALLSPAVQGRIDEMRAAWSSAQPPGDADSSGVRLQLLRITGEAAREHWLAGVGYSNYAQAHRAAAEHVYAGQPNADAFLRGGWSSVRNPHDEYVMQLVSGGIVALALYLAWLVAGLREAARTPGVNGAALAGVVVAFAVGSLVNSMLLDFMEAHLYVGLLAWLIAEGRYGQREGEFDRVLIVATRQIGDVLLTTPLIHAARLRWPQARIDVIGSKGALAILRGNPDVSELVEWPAVGRIARKYDLAVIADVGDRAHLIGWLAARQRTGVIPETNPSNWWKRLLLDHVVFAVGDRGAKHVAVEKQELLAPWVADAGVPHVRAPEGVALPAEIESQLKTGFIVVHAPSMWSYKQWPVAHFEKLVRALVAHTQVVLTGTRDPRDQECIAPLRSIEGTLDVSGKLDFNQLVTLMKKAALYIGPDTSVSHLAAATGVPVIAIFGPTNPLRWAPRPASVEEEPAFVRVIPVQQAGNVMILQSSLHCVPCGRAGCEDHRQSRSDCLNDISPERVIEQALKALS